MVRARHGAVGCGLERTRVMSVAVGQDYIGPYRLLKLIRAGKATQIWEAINPTENERVAIKSLQPTHLKDKAEVAALKHEFEAGHQFRHPTVNRVREFAVARGVPYVVMDFFNAPNLKQCLREFPQRVADHRDAIILQAAEALQHVHEQGWVHCDVKPDNFLLDESGKVKLIDFAISQKVKKGIGRLLSGKGMAQGTRSYMSPEQIRRENVDTRADIYSFGCMLFELFSGRPPFTATTPDELLNKHLRSAPPSLTAFSDEVTPEFSQLVSKLMAKKPEDRVQSMSDFLKELGKISVVKRRLFSKDNPQ